MSSFLVADKTIQRIASYIERIAKSTNDYDVREIVQVSGINPMDSDFAMKLGVSMLDMNHAAVNVRYAEHTLPSLKFSHSPVLAGRIQVLKSLRCFLYQCAEGSVPDRPLYKALDVFSGELALDIVRDLPEWEKGEWG